MKLIEIKHRNTGEVLFSREAVNNTLLKTLRIAIILKHDIRHADLSNADLSHGFFEKTDFSYCDFTNSNLSHGNFYNARFDKASMHNIIAKHGNFEDAVFHGTFLKNANFNFANLKNAISMEGYWNGSDLSNADLRGFGSRSAQLKNLTILNAMLDETDTRIGYKAPTIEIPVCKPPCPTTCQQHCKHNNNPFKCNSFYGDKK